MAVELRGDQRDNHTSMDSEAFRRKVNIDGFATKRKKEKP